MSVLVNIVVTALLVMWGGVLMMSPMMFASEGMRDNRGSILFAMAILGYPIAIFLIMKLLGFRYFGTNVNGWLMTVTGIWLLVIFVYGLPRQLLNIGRGIPNNGYFTSDNAVYRDGKKISDADVKSFKVLDDNRYAADKASVYYYGQRLTDAQPESFRPLTIDSSENANSAVYWRDAARVYHNGTLIKDCDANSFELIDNIYGRDKQHVYFIDRMLDGANPATFRVLNDGVATDGQFIYVAMKRSRTVVDMNTFTYVDSGKYGSFYRDKSNVYLVFMREDEPLAKAEGADPDTFTILERSYAKDKNHVYFFGNYQEKGQRFVKLEGANPNTFTIGYDQETRSEAHDGSRNYLYGEIVKPK